MTTELDVHLDVGRVLRAYDPRPSRAGTNGEAYESLAAVFWFRGSPDLGIPPEPLFEAAEANGLRWISYDRPGYG